MPWLAPFLRHLAWAKSLNSQVLGLLLSLPVVYLSSPLSPTGLLSPQGYSHLAHLCIFTVPGTVLCPCKHSLSDYWMWRGTLEPPWSCPKWREMSGWGSRSSTQDSVEHRAAVSCQGVAAESCISRALQQNSYHSKWFFTKQSKVIMILKHPIVWNITNEATVFFFLVSNILLPLSVYFPNTSLDTWK